MTHHADIPQEPEPSFENEASIKYDTPYVAALKTVTNKYKQWLPMQNSDFLVQVTSWLDENGNPTERAVQLLKSVTFKIGDTEINLYDEVNKAKAEILAHAQKKQSYMRSAGSKVLNFLKEGFAPTSLFKK